MKKALLVLATVLVVCALLIPSRVRAVTDLVIPVIQTPPTASEIIFGDSLSDSSLFDGVAIDPTDSSIIKGSFAWQDPSIVPSVSDSGYAEHLAVFIPAQSKYESVFFKVRLTVNKARQEIFVEPQQNYGFFDVGQNLSAVLIKGDGELHYSLKSGNSVSVDPSTGDLTMLKAGISVITVTASETEYFSEFSTDVTVIVDKAPLTPTVSITDWSFGETGQSPALFGNDGNGDVTFFYKPLDAPDSDYQTTVPSAAGEYTVKVEVTETDEFSAGTATADFTISPLAITPAVSLTGWTFGEAANQPYVTGNTGNGEVTFFYKFKGAPDSSYTSVMPSDAGEYTVRADVSATGNYGTGSASTDFTIAKASLSPVVSIAGWTFGDAPPAPLISGNLGKGALTYFYKPQEASDSSYTANLPVNAGSYTIKAEIAETVNYEAASAVSTFTIARAGISPTLSITGWTYGEKANVPLVDGNSGNGNVSFSYKALDSTDSNFSSNPPTTPGTYTVKAVISETANYGIGVAYADFVILPAPITPEVSVEDWTFGGTAHTPSISGNSGNGSVTFIYKPKDAPDSEYSTAVPINAGDYTVKAIIDATEKYEGGVASCDFIIARSAINPTLSIKGWIFGGMPSSPTLTDNPGNGAVTYLYKPKNADDSKYSTAMPSDAGEYTLKAEVAPSLNYEAGYAVIDFTISKASINPSVSMVGWTFGDACNAPKVTGNSGNGTVSYYFKQKGGSDTTYAIEPPTNAGNYTVKVEIGETANFKAGSATADFTVEKALITPTLSIAGWTFGENANSPSVSGNIGSGDATYSYKLKNSANEHYRSTVPSSAGTYTARVVIAETENYKGAVAYTDFTISKSPLAPIISVNDWTYGEWASLPSLTGNTGRGKVTYMYKPKDADDSYYSLSVPSGAGKYVVKAKIAETDDFEGAEVTGTFTISKAPITPSVSMEGWTFGQPLANPKVTGNRGNGTVTYSYKPKDAADSEYSLAVPIEAGAYTVRAFISETDNFESGTATFDFSIAKAPLNFSLSLEGWTFGEIPNIPVVIGNAGNGAVTFYYKLNNQPDSSYVSTVPYNAGTYTVKAVVTETTNFKAGYAICSFTIEKASITPVLSIEDRVFGERASDPIVTGNLGGAEVTVTYKLWNSADYNYRYSAPTAAGRYTIKIEIGETQNYKGATLTKDFTILPAPTVNTSN